MISNELIGFMNLPEWVYFVTCCGVIQLSRIQVTWRALGEAMRFEDARGSLGRMQPTSSYRKII